MRIYTAIAVACIAAAIAETALADRDVTKLPGYVDFDMGAILGDMDAKVEINLSAPMLKFMAGAANMAGQEIAETLFGIDDVRIKVFSLDSADAEKLQPEIKDLVKWFDKNEWSRIVHVEEEFETVNIYTRLDGDKMAGLALVVASQDELVFINIVGVIDPARMGSIIGRMSGGDEVDLDFLSRIDESGAESEGASNN
jgi:hypothetical protein